MIHRGLKPEQRVGILCADEPSITPALLQANGVGQEIPIAVLGLGDQPQFSNILHSRGVFDYDAIELEVVRGAQHMRAEYDDLGAILLECSDMPPFAHAVQCAVGLPVFDFITMIRWVYHAVVQRPYDGII
jgi:hypothetical protein